jgi:PAS domain S-box-containing protein
LHQIARSSVVDLDLKIRPPFRGVGRILTGTLLTLKKCQRLAYKFFMSGPANRDPRIVEILDHVQRFASGDYRVNLSRTDQADGIDAIMCELNALAERLKNREEAIRDKEFRKLRDSEEQIQTIFRNAPDAVVVINSGDVITRWNPAASAIFGWKEEEVIGKLLHEILIPERYRERHLAGMQHFRKTGQGKILNRTIELPALCKDKAEVEIELTISLGKVNNEDIFIAFLRDITERKRAAAEIQQLNATLEQRVLERTEQLNASELKYRLLFQDNPMALWVLDIATKKFIDVNDSALKIYGYTRKEFLAMSSVELRPEEERERYLTFERNVTGTQNTGVWKHRKKDGSIIHAEVIAHTINMDGKPARLILANDVTERKKMEQEILELNRDLELRIDERTKALLEVNNELESFTYSVSHDLRTPLRAIHGYAQMLAEDYHLKLDAEGIRLLESVKSNARRMGQLVDDLLAFSRMGKITLNETQTDVTRMVKDLVRELTAAQGSNAKVTVHFLGDARADAALLRQVFQNLISNAIKFSSRKAHPEIEMGVKEIEGERTWFIKDNGAGFDMAYYKKLFGVFERLHEQEEFEGTGVGLAVVQRIVQRHGGRIWAVGRVGEGAEFYFTLGTNN